MSTNNGGWTFVARKAKRNQRRTFIATTKCRPIFTPIENRDKLLDLSMPKEKIRKSIVEAEGKFSTKFRKCLFTILERIMNGRKLGAIRIFGIGSFTASRDSLYQLALLECLAMHFHVQFITSQEPLTSKCESNYLKSRGIHVLPVDDLRSAPPLLDSSDDFTLLYMIHCTGEMYENVLSAYRDHGTLQRLILIGNNPHGLEMQAMSIICEQRTPNFAKFSTHSTAIPMPRFEPNDNAFQGTAICFLNEEEENE